MKFMYLIITAAILCLTGGSFHISYAAEKEIINPHWNKDNCNACHKGSHPTAGNPELKFNGNTIELCNSCHSIISKDKYIHAVGMVPDEENYGKMADEFKNAIKKEGKLTCGVCHELKYQCLETESYRKENNPRFFRGGPYAKRTDICMKCHDASKYAIFNPHDQIDDKGQIKQGICVYCHNITPDRMKAKGIEDVTFRVKDDLNRLCTRCHRSEIDLLGCITNEGKTLNHHVKASLDVRERIKRFEQDNDIIFPLEPSTGKVFCATCHNPHKSGVQILSRANKGADSSKRLRSESVNSCNPCHKEGMNVSNPTQRHK
ncbi:MAG: hypothetical protein HZB79_08865 [Deltaproteobacteria bacterium]|nr:hypothetical protein [Deltaproteobacteria bacterium]